MPMTADQFMEMDRSTPVPLNAFGLARMAYDLAA